MKKIGLKVLSIVGVLLVLFTIANLGATRQENENVRRFVTRHVPIVASVLNLSPVITIGTVEAAGVADYTATGANDNVPFQAALNALPASGGEIKILAGTYVFAAAITRAIDNVTFTGVGRATYLTRDGASAIITAGGNNWVVQQLRTDANAGIGMGATTGWTWNLVWTPATFYEHRDVAGSSVFTTTTTTTANITTLNAPTGRGATLVVAASNATATEKAQADYVATGVNDDLIINPLLVAGYNIVLTHGDLYGGTLTSVASNWTLGGSGMGTVYHLKNAANADVILVGDNGTHNPLNITIRDMWLDGNKANQASGSGIHFFNNVDQSSILNVGGQDFKDRAIWLDSTNYNTGNHSNKIDGIAIKGYGGNAIEIDVGSNDGSLTNTKIWGNAALGGRALYNYADDWELQLFSTGGANDNTTCGIELGGYGHHGSIYVENGKTVGAKIEGTKMNLNLVLSTTGGDALQIDGTWNNINVVVDHPTGIGIHANSSATDNLVNGTVYNTTSYGVYNQGARNAFSMKVYTPAGYGIWDRNNVGSSWIGSSVYGGLSIGMILDGTTYTQVTGGILENNSQTDGSQPELDIEGNASYITISGMAILDNAITKSTTAIHEYAGSTNNTYTGIHMTGQTNPPTFAGTDQHIINNAGYIATGEIRTYSGAIIGTAIDNGAIMLSVDNPFGQAVRVQSVHVEITVQASAAATMDAGIGSSASGDYTTMLAALPLNPGTTYPYFYGSATTLVYGKQIPGVAGGDAINWATGAGNRYLNFYNPSINPSGVVFRATYTVTVMGN